jgi:hypothetical protein
MENPDTSTTPSFPACGDLMDRYHNLPEQDREKAAQTIARSFYRLLRRNGFSRNQVISMAGYLLDGLLEDKE